MGLVDKVGMKRIRLISFWRAEMLISSGKPRFTFDDRPFGPQSLNAYLEDTDEKVGAVQVLSTFQRRRITKV